MKKASILIIITLTILLIIIFVLTLTGCNSTRTDKIIDLATSQQINNIDYIEELENIKKELGIIDFSGDVKIERFSLFFNADNEITKLDFDLIERKDDFLLHRISFNPEKSYFSVETTRVGEWGQYERLIDVDTFFAALNLLELSNILPRLSEYRIFSSGEILDNYSDIKNNNYLITSSGLEELPENSLPIKAFIFYTSWYNQYWIYPLPNNIDERALSIHPITNKINELEREGIYIKSHWENEGVSNVTISGADQRTIYKIHEIMGEDTVIWEAEESLFIQGKITEINVSDDSEHFGSIKVEGIQGEKIESAVISIYQETKILHLMDMESSIEKQRALTFTDLEKGQTVEVWIVGVILLTKPPLAGASKIFITESNDRAY